jgi:hypothetical protein
VAATVADGFNRDGVTSRLDRQFVHAFTPG